MDIQEEIKNIFDLKKEDRNFINLELEKWEIELNKQDLFNIIYDSINKYTNNIDIDILAFNIIKKIYKKLEAKTFQYLMKNTKDFWLNYSYRDCNGFVSLGNISKSSFSYKKHIYSNWKELKLELDKEISNFKVEL